MSRAKTATGNYLAGNSPHAKRNKGDLYATPYHCTHLLLDSVYFPGRILEPACGKGAITDVLALRGYNCTSYDIETDFLKETRQFDIIITNPPYRLANDFILKAKTVATQKIAFLLPLNYLQGNERYNTIFQDKEFPLQYVMPFTRYLLMTEDVREDGTCGHGMIAFAWYVWNKDYCGSPVIRWLDNNSFIRR